MVKVMMVCLALRPLDKCRQWEMKRSPGQAKRHVVEKRGISGDSLNRCGSKSATADYELD